MPETSPNGCAHCGITEHHHAQRWTQDAGWHKWTPPTDAQRLERMRARNPKTPSASHATEAPQAALSAMETGANPENDPS